MINVSKMHTKGSSSDIFRVSISSAHSTSSHGSMHDDDSFGDVYVWGEFLWDNHVKNCSDSVTNAASCRTDVLLPKLLESNLVLDVHHLACGVRHAALVTRHGETFTWGEESGGRLGHGMECNFVQPRMVESLVASHAEFVACGEFHTCVLTTGGDLYSWGDGAYNVGLLGHGGVSHWIPKRVLGPLDGLQVVYVSCGTWHTALISSNGQLFTFGDGTFGVLGHGNKESISCPREVESLMGLKTITVSCGVWHTAAVVEVMVTQSSASVSSGKLFTWGDGDKYRLGHADKEPRLKPTCVASLIDYDFCKVACAHSLTVGITTNGQVLSMGSCAYGQLGNPRYDGRLPCLVEDNMFGECAVEVACGSYHVAVLTTKSEVFTWGKGANGRLGHGDVVDRKIPTLVEALKDRLVKNIACGASFTSAICHYKWVSGSEQSQCASCRQAFGFTRKRHNCYNCGLVNCHACSSRKALKAALAPNPGKPYRVCDSCYVKLTKVSGSIGTTEKKKSVPPVSSEGIVDVIRGLDIKAAKHGRKTDAPSLLRTTPISLLAQLKDIDFHGAFHPSAAHAVNLSRAVSPFSRKPIVPHSVTSIPSTGLLFPHSAMEDLKKDNELLIQENERLHAQVDSLQKRCECQEVELQISEKKAQEATAMATEEANKSKAAKEVIKSLTAQIKEMAERLPQESYDNEEKKEVNLLNGSDSRSTININRNQQSANDLNFSPAQNANTAHGSFSNGNSGKHYAVGYSTIEFDEPHPQFQNHGIVSSPSEAERSNRRPHIYSADLSMRGNRVYDSDCMSLHSGEDGNRSRNAMSSAGQLDAEWIEQYEPGVYITLAALPDGTRDLKRVRFSRRRFGEHQAEAWWTENREEVYTRYNVRRCDRISSAASTHSAR